MTQVSEETVQHLTARGFREPFPGESAESYCRAFGHWLAPQLTWASPHDSDEEDNQ